MGIIEYAELSHIVYLYCSYFAAAVINEIWCILFSGVIGGLGYNRYFRCVIYKVICIA